MPTLTTQSIGIEGTRLAGQQNQGVSANRLAQASGVAGVQESQQRREAQRSATQAQRDDQRTINRQERRTEGSFSNQSRPRNDDEQQENGEEKRLDTVA